MLGGLRSGGLIIIAARPGMGKSALALNIVQKAATLYEVPAAVLAGDVKEEVGNRMLSTQSLVSNQALQTGELQADGGTKSPGRCPAFTLLHLCR